MKTHLTFIFVFMAFIFGTSHRCAAQSISDFESLSLSVESYWDGADMSGTPAGLQFITDFSSGDAMFYNVYDTSWGADYAYWSGGWAYSNMTDSTTSGASNMYSSRAGSGALSSSNYLLGTNNSVIGLSGAAISNPLKGIYITNSTYAANSMRDGDMFAKKFTNKDKDWFKLSIKGYSGGNMKNDSVVLYLADFTHQDSTLDHIVTGWQYADLSVLNTVDSIIFLLSSSDGDPLWGMNTPAIFCIDNFNSSDPAVAVNNYITKESFEIYPNPATDLIHVKLNEDLINNSEIFIVDMTGRTIYYDNQLTGKNIKLDLNTLNKGIYQLIVQNNNSILTQTMIKQ